MTEAPTASTRKSNGKGSVAYHPTRRCANTAQTKNSTSPTAAAAPAETSNRLRVPTATLTVTDSGAGMSREFIQERLFKPFDTTTGSQGMGIGAYQVREYVQSLGGRVDVASEEGRGTRFTLRIPLALAPD